MVDVATAVALSLAPGEVRFRAVSLLRGAPAATGRPLSLEQALEQVLGEGARDLRRLASRLGREAGVALRTAADGGVTAIAWTDPRYPAALLTLTDAPPVLWAVGRLDSLQAPAVAVVGSRAPTPAGRQVALALGRDLAAAGLVVVSGLARGIDGAAHEGALSAGLTTAVLGCGVDRPYPPEHRRLAERVAQSGVVLSEFPPATAPHAHHFPLRNRLISGLAAAVVVVEAADRSGSLITARWALEQGRDVLAVPGSVLSGRSRGCHALIRDGAALVESAEDVLAELGRVAPTAGRDAPAHPGASDPVLAAMPPGEAMSLDVLMAETGLSAPRVLERLLEAELAGAVERTGAGRFCRLDR